MELRTHQTKNRDNLIEILGRVGAGLDGSDTGTGKSYTAAAMAAKLHARPAIVCPLPCIPAWSALCAEFGLDPVFVANYERCRSGSFEFGGFDTTGKSRMYKWRPDGRVLFIFDEIQRCRDQTSLNSKMLFAAAQQYKCLLLSATPFTTPLEAFSIGHTLRLFTMNGYPRWCGDHGVKKDRYTHRMRFVGGEEDMQRIHTQIFPSRGVRTRREEIPGFPQTTISAEAIETGATSEIEQFYLDELAARKRQDIENAMQKAMAGRMDDLPEGWQDEVELQAITVDLRARQEVELLKCPVMVELAQDAVDKGESVAVFVNFDATIEVLRRRLKTDCVLRGKSRRGGNNFDSHNAVRSFQENREPIILVNNAAGGAGVSLHDTISRKPRTSLISPPWSAIVLKQVLGRIHRDGGGYSTQKLLFAAGTVEERVMARVRSRLSNLDALVDGDFNII